MAGVRKASADRGIPNIAGIEIRDGCKIDNAGAPLRRWRPTLAAAVVAEDTHNGAGNDSGTARRSPRSRGDVGNVHLGRLTEASRPGMLEGAVRETRQAAHEERTVCSDDLRSLESREK